MNQAVDIPRLNANTLYVFAINLSDDEIIAAQDTVPPHMGLLSRLLVQPLDRPEQAEFLPIADLEGLGLTGYLNEGPGIPEANLSPHKSRLDALKGHVLLLFPGAFSQDVTLTLGPELTFIAALDQEPTDWSENRVLKSEAATQIAPPKTRKKPSDAAMSGRIATVVLLLLGLLTWLMVWVAS